MDPSDKRRKVVTEGAEAIVRTTQGNEVHYDRVVETDYAVLAQTDDQADRGVFDEYRKHSVARVRWCL